jgi:toxin ParE1/3/4
VTSVVLSVAADRDHAEILEHLEREAGWRVADRYAADFRRLYAILGDFPMSGALRPSLGRHIRLGVVLPYLLIYEHVEGDDMVRILRILHGSRRIGRKHLR